MNKIKTLLIALLVVSTACKKTKTIEPAIRAKKILVVLGSSTAFGTGATPIDSSWVNKVRLKLTNEKKGDTVYNLAVAGYTTYQIMPAGTNANANRPSPDPASNINKAISLKPDLIIINMPSNDIAAGYSTAEIIANYNTIVKVINTANIPFIITSTQPRNLPQLEERKRLQSFNDDLLKIVPANVLDIYSSLTDFSNFNILPDLGAGDGIHLNNKGHAVIYKKVVEDDRFKKVFAN